MPHRLIHQRFDVYRDGTHLGGRQAILIDDRRAKTLVMRQVGRGDVLSLTDVELASETRTRREMTMTFVGLEDGEEVTVTAVKRDCGCHRR